MVLLSSHPSIAVKISWNCWSYVFSMACIFSRSSLKAKRAAQEGRHVEEDPDAALLWALRQL